jgi:hypothetical protein
MMHGIIMDVFEMINKISIAVGAALVDHLELDAPKSDVAK